jgi:hypothetical protein
MTSGIFRDAVSCIASTMPRATSSPRVMPPLDYVLRRGWPLLAPTPNEPDFIAPAETASAAQTLSSRAQRTDTRSGSVREVESLP